MGIDKKMFLNEFKAEAGDYLIKLNESLLALDKNPEKLDCLQKMRKDIHTLKGAARMLGFKEIAELTHSIEFIFEAIANKRIAINSLIANTLFASFDMLQAIIDKLVKEEAVDLDYNFINEGLNKISRDEQGTESFNKALKALLEKVKEQKTGKERSDADEQADNAPETQEIIKIKSPKIDELLGLSGEIVVDKIRCVELLKGFRNVVLEIRSYSKLLKSFSMENVGTAPKGGTDTKTADIIKGIEEIGNQVYAYQKEYEATINHMTLIIDKMQESILSLRMLPMNTIFEFFPRAVRDIAQQYNKKISLEIKGGETELDKKMLEVIKEPLIHIIRNSIGHGIEPAEERKQLGKPEEGRIIIFSWQEGDHVFISIEDDGKGFNPKIIKEAALKKKIISEKEANEMSDRELIYLTFRSGFSTAKVTNELSGRGVGLEIVKDKVEQLKGEVNVDTCVDKGSKFIIKLPLTLSVTSAVLVRSASKCFAIPSANIDEVIKAKNKDVRYIEGRPVINLERRIIPLVDLKDVLGLTEEKPAPDREKYFIVVISYERQRKGFIVDEIISQGGIVVKNLGDYIGNIKNIAGATILVNGDIVLLLNVPDLMRIKAAEAKVLKPREKKEGKKAPEKKTILVAEDSLTTREMERSILETIGYKVIVAGDGLEALERLALKQVDLVITDVQMPRMDGWELTAKIKKDEKYKNIPVIIVTTLGSPEDKKKGIELGASAYMLKSEFEQDKLVQLIETFIG